MRIRPSLLIGTAFAAFSAPSLAQTPPAETPQQTGPTSQEAIAQVADGTGTADSGDSISAGPVASVLTGRVRALVGTPWRMQRFMAYFNPEAFSSQEAYQFLQLGAFIAKTAPQIGHFRNGQTHVVGHDHGAGVSEDALERLDGFLLLSAVHCGLHTQVRRTRECARR